VVWLIALGHIGLSGRAADAQVRPDTIKRAQPDTAKKPDSAFVRRPVTDSAKRALADSILAKQKADSVRNALAQARIDSIYKLRLADTIKSPLAHFETPDEVEVTDRLHFTRAQILSTGAVNLADLLDRVPGVTTYRTGWVAGIHTAAYAGDFRRVRVFYDGIERDAVEPRNDGVLDLTDIPLASLDEIVIERSASEVRVWLRGWTVRRTTAYTRVDIFTGDLNTNGFRGHFAKRFTNGFSFQFVGQQVATQTGRVSAFTTTGTQTGAGDGTQQLVDLRLGWSRGRWTVDGQGIGISRDRDPQTAAEGFTSLPSFKGGRREAFVRVAYGDSARGLWGQAMVGALRTTLQGLAATTGTVDSTLSRDTVRSRTQQVLAVGYRAAAWHVSLTDRVRNVYGEAFHAPLLRAAIGGDRYRVSALAERRALDSLTQVEVSAIARPLTWLALTASQARRTPDEDTERPAGSATRAEAAVHFRRLWLGAGVIRESAMKYASPVVFGAPAATIPSLATTGVLGSVHGALYKDINLDVQAIKWDAAQFSRPKLDVRTELSLVSNWLSQFPKGQFGINLRFAHEFRDPVPFFWSANGKTEQRVAQASQVVTGLLEIRIQSATLFYQYRNLTGQAYEQIPGIVMPRAVQTYGVRWEFWN
jgi:hypothetical protein